MYPCFETIRVEAGRARHLDFHQRRVDATRRELAPGAEPLQLARFIPKELPVEGLFRLRIVYSPAVESVTIEPYHRRTIRSLACVSADGVDYHRKWIDRDTLNALKTSRSDADDVILVRNGLITDSSYSNLAFWDGSTWMTPRVPLLEGTARARLIEEGILVPADIALDQLERFTQVSLINALNDPGDTVVPVSAIWCAGG